MKYVLCSPQWPVEEFTQKGKLSHCLLTLMLMESGVKFHSPQNISGASQQNSVAVLS